MMEQFNLIYSMLDERHQKQFGWVLFTACLLSFLEALSIIAIFYFFSFISESSSPSLDKVLSLISISVEQDDVLKVGLSVLIILVVKNSYALWCNWYQNHYISYVRHSISIRLLFSIISRQYPYFLKQNSDVLEARFLTDIDRITDGYLRGVIALISEGMVAFGIISILLVNDFKVTLIVLSGLSVIGLALHWVLKRIAGLTSQEFTEAQHARYFFGGMLMSGIKDIKSCCTETFFHKMFSNASKKFSRIQIIQTMIITSPRVVIETLAFAAIVLSLTLVVFDGEGIQAMLPIIALYAAAGYRILPSLNRIIASLQQIKFAEEPVQGVHQMMFQSDGFGCMENIENVESLRFERSIAVSDLSYKYPETTSHVLDHISFSIQKNEFVGIVGASGAGKSTLIDILLALFSPTSGTVKIDNRLLSQANSRGWRRSIGYVPQSIFLLDDSIANNIAFGRNGDVDMNEVQRVAKLAQVDDFVSSLPEGYVTPIGENGARLSGGQRQRIGIARALYGETDIILMDEATSALDPETEREVTKSILSLAGKVTMIVVAHRIAAIRHADKLLVLEKGTVAGEGTFDDLLISCKAFNRIASHS
jgi:ATP-binding cassette, subfamily B, bacterial PglK